MNHRLDTDTHVYFYENEFYPLSNFSAFQVEYDGLCYQTAEHAYQCQKFIHQTDIWWKIFDAASAHEAFKIAEANAEFVHPRWPEMRIGIMEDILRVKANQHEYVRRKLLETGDRVLVEDSWRDAFWGIGPNGDGENMMGKLWMKLRDEIRGKLNARHHTDSRP